MATPIWNEKEKRWTLRIKKNGIERKFTSVEPGIKGKKIVLARARAAEGVRDDKITVEKEAEKYLADLKARVSYSYYNGKRKLLRLYVLPFIGRYRVNNIRVQDLQNILNKARKKDGSSLSKATLHEISNTLKSLMKFCRKDGLDAPYEIDLLLPRNAPKVEREILYPEQLKRLFDTSESFSDNQYINLYRLGVLTGLRPGELVALKWSDYNGLTLRVQRAYNAYNIMTEGKNESAKRTLYLGDLAKSVLHDQKIKTEHLNSEWIFCRVNGELTSQACVTNAWALVKKELNSNATLYSLRHTFISMLQSGSGVSEHAIKSYVGHTKSMNTFGVYGHDIREDKVLEADNINTVLKRHID